MCSQFRSPRVSSVEYRRPRPANCNDSLSPQGLAAVGLYEVGERWLMNKTLSDEKERKRKSGGDCSGRCRDVPQYCVFC